MIDELQGITDIEVIIVDDASTQTIAFQLPENSQLIPLKKNSGPAHARNVGAKQAKYQNLLFIDSDVQFEKAAIETAKKLFQDPEVKAFIAAPALTPVSKKYFQRYKTYLENFWMPTGAHTSVADTKFFGIRKEVFEEAGGFDESYKKAAVEDYEFGYRLREQGISIHFIRKIKVQHDHGTFTKFFKNTFHRTRSWMQLQKKFRQGFDNHGTSFMLALSQVAAINLFFLFIASCFNPFIFLPFLINLLVLLTLTSKLWMILLHRKESLPFYFYTAFCYVILSVPVIAGAALGFLDNLLATSKEKQ